MRAWVIPFLVIALVTGAVLYLTRDDGAEETGGGVRPPPDATDPKGTPILTDADVRAYLRVWPRMDQEIRKVIQRIPGGNFDSQAMKAEITARVEILLKAENLSSADWDQLRNRVESVVHAIRWERERPDRERKLREEIEQKERAAAAVDGTQRDRMEADLKVLRARIGAPGAVIAGEDTALVQSYWNQLDPIVPGTTPPQRQG